MSDDKAEALSSITPLRNARRTALTYWLCRMVNSHALGVAETVELARSLGRLPRCLVAYLVEGERFTTGAPLSPAVAGAVEDVAERVVLELSALLRTNQAEGSA